MSAALTRCLLALGLAVVASAAACDSGDSSVDGCHRAQDCPGGSCIAGACVMLTNPLDASIPDMALIDSLGPD